MTKRQLKTRDASPVPMTRAAAFAVLIATAVGLGACGKKGDPEYPDGRQMQTTTKPDGTTEKKPVKPSRSFPLDPLLN